MRKPERVRGYFDSCCLSSIVVPAPNPPDKSDCCRRCGESGVQDVTHTTHAGDWKCQCFSISGKAILDTLCFKLAKENH